MRIEDVKPSDRLPAGARTGAPSALDRIEARWNAAADLIREVERNGRRVFAIDLKDADGKPTGETREGTWGALILFLVRNGYA